MKDVQIAVLGAGIVGLNTALEIQKRFSDVGVTVIAEKFDKDTTSDGAAGLFLLLPNFKGPTMEITNKWVKDSYDYYDHLMKSENCGVVPVSGYSYTNGHHDECEIEPMKLSCSEYRPATTEELNSSCNVKFEYGIYMSTMLIPGRKFLPWALEKFKGNGGTVIRERVNDFDRLSKYDVVFNCSGLNAKYLCNDPEVYPIRGQILQVKAPWIKQFYNWGMNYIIPCGYDGIVTLGGTQDFNSFDTNVDKYVAASIMNKCSNLLPALRTTSFVRHWVGLRPYRTTVRVELESRNKSVLIHNYGHAGNGVTAAPGTAIHAVDLFQEHHRRGNTYSKL